VHFIDDQQRDSLHVLALLPASREHVPLVRRRDQQCGALEQLEVARGLAGQLLDAAAGKFALFNNTRNRLAPPFLLSPPPLLCVCVFG